MMEYGSRSPIGIRQERLLQGLMREIVRMTAQKQPLEVGVPLYPFSHHSLFRKDESPRSAPEDSAAPLPSTPFEEPGSTPPASSHNRPTASAGWPMQDPQTCL